MVLVLRSFPCSFRCSAVQFRYNYSFMCSSEFTPVYTNQGKDHLESIWSVINMVQNGYNDLRKTPICTEWNPTDSLQVSVSVHRTALMYPFKLLKHYMTNFIPLIVPFVCFRLANFILLFNFQCTLSMHSLYIAHN